MYGAGSRLLGQDRVALQNRLHCFGIAAHAMRSLPVDHARLAAEHPRQLRIIELRYVSGLCVEETAETQGDSIATVERDWTVVRPFLRRALGDRG